MSHRECSSCKDPLLDSDGHSESIACLGSTHAEAALTVSSCLISFGMAKDEIAVDVV